MKWVLFTWKRQTGMSSSLGKQKPAIFFKLLWSKLWFDGGHTIIRNCFLWVQSASFFTLFCMFYLFWAGYRIFWWQSDAVCCSQWPVRQVLQWILLEAGTNGGNTTQFVSLVRITRHVGGAGCLHPPVTNKGLFCQDRILELRIGNRYFLKVEYDEEMSQIIMISNIEKIIYCQRWELFLSDLWRHE